MLEHGGRLRQAARQHGIALPEWLDLSTGINPDTWPVLRDHAAAFASSTDALAMRGMRIYGNPLPGDPVVRAGESGAVTLGLLAELMQAPQHAMTRTALGLDATARVLLVNTEGDTDPQRYLDIVWG